MEMLVLSRQYLNAETEQEKGFELRNQQLFLHPPLKLIQ